MTKLTSARENLKRTTAVHQRDEDMGGWVEPIAVLTEMMIDHLLDSLPSP